LLFDRKNRDFLRFGRKKSRFLRIAYKSESWSGMASLMRHSIYQ
jgi:hypothetical protein